MGKESEFSSNFFSEHLILFSINSRKCHKNHSLNHVILLQNSQMLLIHTITRIIKMKQQQSLNAYMESDCCRMKLQ